VIQTGSGNDPCNPLRKATMKTKQYTFTERELIVLRNALANYKFTLPLTNPKSELSENAKKEMTLTYALHDQFKTDARII